MSLSVAIAGKGGVGKTTLAALLVRSLIESGVRPVLAVDADPNSCLGDALGLACGKTLAEIRETGASPEGSPASGLGRARAVEDEIQREGVVEGDGFDVVTMGRSEGPKCYCYVNSLLRKSLDELSRGYAAVVLDNEAGMEHLSRRTTNRMDWLVVVTDPTLPALRAAGRILELSRSLPITIGRRGVVANRAPGKGLAEAFEKELAAVAAANDVERLPDVPQDDALERAAAEGGDVFGVASEALAVHAVGEIVQRLRAEVEA
jgi:CO dehydrogenase maturation factor